jgi:peptide/nickel transport system permease protein
LKSFGRFPKIREFWTRFSRSRGAVIGLVIVGLFTAVAALTPLFAPDPGLLNFHEILLPPSLSHPLGTDDFGRNLLVRMLWGSRVSLFIGFTAALVSISVGILVGAAAGYFGGVVDVVLMRLVDTFLVIPTFFLALLIVAFVGHSIYLITFAIAITNWPEPARLLRGQFLSLREREFVESARMLGAGDFHIIFREILPSAIFPVIIVFGYQIAGAILTESGLSFLGLGDPNAVSWGWLLNDALRTYDIAWWMSFFPGVAIALTVIAFNLISDGLNDSLNPRLRVRRFSIGKPRQVEDTLLAPDFLEDSQPVEP